MVKANPLRCTNPKLFGLVKQGGYWRFSTDQRYIAYFSTWSRETKYHFESWLPVRWQSWLPDEFTSLNLYDSTTQKESLTVSGFTDWQFLPEIPAIITVAPSGQAKLWRLPPDEAWLTVVGTTIVCWLIVMSIPWLLKKAWRSQFASTRVIAEATLTNHTPATAASLAQSPDDEQHAHDP